MFYDETVAGSTGLLEHPCSPIIDLNTQNMLSLQTSSLFSAVLTTSGKIYWWLVILRHKCNNVLIICHLVGEYCHLVSKNNSWRNGRKIV